MNRNRLQLTGEAKVKVNVFRSVPIDVFGQSNIHIWIGLLVHCPMLISVRFTLLILPSCLFYFISSNPVPSHPVQFRFPSVPFSLGQFSSLFWPLCWLFIGISVSVFLFLVGAYNKDVICFFMFHRVRL